MSGSVTQSRSSARRKAEVVVRALRGEGVDALSRELRVPAHQIAPWRDESRAAGTDALEARFARGLERGRPDRRRPRSVSCRCRWRSSRIVSKKGLLLNRMWVDLVR